MARACGLEISPNTIERICLDVGHDLMEAEQGQWKSVLTGEVPVPQVAIVEFDGGRIRTRQPGHGPGVHLSAKGWNETKNAIFVSASSSTSDVDPDPEPPACFLDPDHVAKLTEKAKIKETQAADDSLPDEQDDDESKRDRQIDPPHKPKRLLRTVLSSMKNSRQFGKQMSREAKRRRFNGSSSQRFLQVAIWQGFSVFLSIKCRH